MSAPSTKAVLYQNTLELFYQKGFKATTMREIADSMNFEAASIYNYIESKQALLEELVFEVADQFLAGILFIKESQLSNIEKIKSVISLYVQITSQNPYKAAMLTSEWRNLDDPALLRFKDHRARFEGHLRDIIRDYLKENPNSKINLEMALHTFLGSIRWIYEWYIKNKSNTNPIEIQHQLTLLILGGLSNTE